MPGQPCGCDVDPPAIGECPYCSDNRSPDSLDIEIEGVLDDNCTGADAINDIYTIPAVSACEWGDADAGGANEIDITGAGIKITDSCIAATAMRLHVLLTSGVLRLKVYIYNGSGDSEVATFEATPIEGEPCCAWDEKNVAFLSAIGSDATLANDWSTTTATITADDDCAPCSHCEDNESPDEFRVVIGSQSTLGTKCSTAKCAAIAGTYIVPKLHPNGCGYKRVQTVDQYIASATLPFICNQTGTLGSITVTIRDMSAYSLGTPPNNIGIEVIYFINDPIQARVVTIVWADLIGSGTNPADCLGVSGKSLTFRSGRPALDCDDSATTCTVTAL